MISNSLVQTEKIAEDFFNKISIFNNTEALVVGLFGDLGSGKTTFTQALGKCLNIKEVMTSPTFVIMKKYEIKHANFSTLIHIDAYRLLNGQELAKLYFEEMAKNRENIILIEWPERVLDILPSNLIKINFKFISETEREITFMV